MDTPWIMGTGWHPFAHMSWRLCDPHRHWHSVVHTRACVLGCIYNDKCYNVHTLIFQVCVFVCFFTKRQHFPLVFFRIAFLSSESPVGKSWKLNCPNQITPLDMFWFAQVTLNLNTFSYMSWFAQTIPPHFFCLSFTNNYPNKCLCLYKLSQCISWFSQTIPVEFFPTCQVRVVPHLPGEGCSILSELFFSSSSSASSSPPPPPPPVSPRPCLRQLPPALPPCQLFAKLFANSLRQAPCQLPSSVCTAGPQPGTFPDQCAPLDLFPAQCALLDLNLGTFPAQCALLDLNLGPSQLSVHRWTSTWDLPSSVCTAGPQPGTFPTQCAPLDLNGQIECQIKCQIECQKICQIEC